MSTQTTRSFVSDKANKIEPSITMATSSLASQLRKEGKDVIGLSAGEPDFDTPEAIKEAGIQAIKDGKTKYTPAAGIIELKEAVVRKLSRQGLSYAADDVVISCGAKHSIYNILLAVINPGDEVIVPGPYWVSYPHQVRMADGIPKIIETTDQTQFKISAAQLEASLTEKTKVLILNSPSNPTGMVYTREELEAIAEVVVKHQILVISDEIYENLIYEGEHLSIASISDEVKNLTVIVNGVSKAYSMTGWRIGYCAGPIAIAKAIGKIQSHSTSNPAAPSQWASVEALDGPQDEVERMRLAFDERRDLMVSGLNKIPGVTCLSPQGAFYAFPNISALFGKSSGQTLISSSSDFCQQLLNEALVACVPGSGFGADNYMRLSYATSPEQIRIALSRIEEWVATLS
ncbi:MAG: aspartate aminotransferase [Candidatus Marinamargulisbacteria bacterium]|jgi:aspartate aminotransferase